MKVAADRVGPTSRGGAFDAFSFWLGHVFSIPYVGSTLHHLTSHVRPEGVEGRDYFLGRPYNSSSTSSPATAVAVRRSFDEGRWRTHRKTRHCLTCSGERRRAQHQEPVTRNASECLQFDEWILRARCALRCTCLPNVLLCEPNTATHDG